LINAGVNPAISFGGQMQMN